MPADKQISKNEWALRDKQILIDQQIVTDKQYLDKKNMNRYIDKNR